MDMTDANNFFNLGNANVKTKKKAKELNYLNFDAIKIGIASPQKIHACSFLNRLEILAIIPGISEGVPDWPNVSPFHRV